MDVVFVCAGAVQRFRHRSSLHDKTRLHVSGEMLQQKLCNSVVREALASARLVPEGAATSAAACCRHLQALQLERHILGAILVRVALGSSDILQHLSSAHEQWKRFFELQEGGFTHVLYLDIVEAFALSAPLPLEMLPSTSAPLVFRLSDPMFQKTLVAGIANDETVTAEARLQEWGRKYLLNLTQKNAWPAIRMEIAHALLCTNGVWNGLGLNMGATPLYQLSKRVQAGRLNSMGLPLLPAVRATLSLYTQQTSQLDPGDMLFYNRNYPPNVEKAPKSR